MSINFNIATLGLLLALGVGCFGLPDQEPALGEPYVRVAVEEFTHHSTASVLRVTGGPGSQEACGIVATVDDETRYLRRDPSGEIREGSRAEVSVGDTVEVHVSGDVQESCPVQGYGEVIVMVHDIAS
jgi:hypothetical protein